MCELRSPVRKHADSIMVELHASLEYVEMVCGGDESGELSQMNTGVRPCQSPAEAAVGLNDPFKIPG